MIDLAIHAVNLHALPVAGLLKLHGFPTPLAEFVAGILLERANQDRALDVASEGGEPIALALDGQSVDDASERDWHRHGGAGNFVAASAPASLLASSNFERLVDALNPGMRRWQGDMGLERGAQRGTLSSRLDARRAMIAALLRITGSVHYSAEHALAELFKHFSGERAAVAAAFAGWEAAGTPLQLAVVHGVDLEYACGERPRCSVTRQLARLRALAAAAGGRIVPFVPCDPFRPECVTLAREALQRGFAGITLVSSGWPVDEAVINAYTLEDPRDIESRVIELASLALQSGAPIYVPDDSGTGPGGVLFSREEHVVLRWWSELLERRRFRKLRICFAECGPCQRSWNRKALQVAKAVRGHESVFMSCAPCLLEPVKTGDVRASLLHAFKTSPRLARRVLFHSGAPIIANAHAAAHAVGEILALRSGLAKHADALRFGNALEYLNLPGYLKRCGEALAPEERAGLERLIASGGKAPAIVAPRVATRTAKKTSRARTRSRGQTRSRGSTMMMVAAAPAFDCECLVLGAGIAGLAAARDLARPLSVRDTPRSVIVVEASDRIGGRLHTLHTGFDGPIELGAELIHRPRTDQPMGGFSLWGDIDHYGLATRSIQKLQGSHVWFPSWKSGVASEVLRAGCAVCQDSDVAKALDVLTRAAQRSLFNGDDESGEALVNRLLATHELPRENAEAMADLLLTGTIPARLAELSVAGAASDKVKAQELSTEEYHVSAGYSALAAALANGIDVRTGFRVARIAWGATAPRGCIEIESDDGRVLRSRSAVITFSVGVLKHGIASGSLVFDPALPAVKQDALDRLENGPISKVLLRFDARFWPLGMSILGNPQRARRAGRSYFVPFFGVAGAPPVLTALFNSEEVRELDRRMEGRSEAVSDGVGAAAPPQRVVDYVQTKILADLRELFPAAATATLERWHVRSWANDPFVRGGTSFIRFEPGRNATAAAVRRDLADHLPTLPLYWAGEATAVGTNPWSVHGAHQSGRTAARNLHALLELPSP